MRKKCIILYLSCYFTLIYGVYENDTIYLNSIDFGELDKEIEHIQNEGPKNINAKPLNDMQKLLYITQLNDKLNDMDFYATENKVFQKNNLFEYKGQNNSHIIKKRIADNEEAAMITTEIIQKYGYPAESFSVTSKDGYVLGLHRIPYGKKSPMCRNTKKPVVLCMHDITSSSSDFIINGPEISLGYLLADAGYDVWLGNVRGNRYSRKHMNLLPSNNAFWDFTFHEMGVFDVPAIIDFILTETEEAKLTYIGHSMGSTLLYVMLSEHPQYNDKLKVAFNLSPVVYLSWMMSPLLRFFSIFSNLISLFFDVIGVSEWTPRFDIMTQFGQLVCKGQDFTNSICTSVLFILSGYNMKNLNMTRFPIYMGHTPAGASLKTFVHYGQIIQSGSFKQMDWGVAENLARYNSLKAPRYKLLNMRTPVYLFYSLNDWFANKNDIDRLYRELEPGIAQLIEVKDPQFAHVDFLFGTNAKEEVYDNLLELIKRH